MSLRAVLLVATLALAAGCTDPDLTDPRTTDYDGHFHDRTQPDSYLRGWPDDPPAPSVPFDRPPR